MKGILLMDSKEYPNTFEGSDIDSPEDVPKTEYISNKIVESLNKYNYKWNIVRYEYVDLSSRFNEYLSYKFNGLIVDEFEIDAAQKERFLDDGCFIYEQDGKYICQRIVIYVFFSQPIEGFRNSFVSQIMFPSLLEYANTYMGSPSYTIANHPICYINYVNKKVTATEIRFPLACLCAAGMNYVDVFEESINVNEIPLDFKDFMCIYNTNYNQVDSKYENNYYIIDFDEKKMIWKTDKIIQQDLSIDEGGKARFKGSQEKFHWNNLLPVSLAARKMGYNIDYSNYQAFVNDYLESNSSDKMIRCKTLLNYIKKYTGLKVED